MLQGYKIFFDDRVIILTDKINKSFEKNDGLFYKYGQKDELTEIFNVFQHFTKIKTLYILHDKVEELFEIVKSYFVIQEAAGGIVKRNDGKILAIYRRGKWDLPKGKVEKGEFYKQTALREVKEECGLYDIEIEKKLMDTFHTYHLNEKLILKRTIWYVMTLKSDEVPIIQTSEDISDYMWFDYDTVKEIMKNTYESLKDIFITIISDNKE